MVKLFASFSTKFLKIFLPTKFDFNPNWGNFYNMWLFSFELSKSLLLRFPPPHKNFPSSKISHLPNGQISHGFPQVLRTWEAWIDTCGETGGDWGRVYNAVEIYLWRSSYNSKVASYKRGNLLKMNFFTHIFQGF